ncbi:hypothetical protein MTO98_04130 [Mucilaginibacter sp. SMC90]|nr:hypothetical protein [Mucilaginibacter sp. SMC90]UOE50259.1 hypothetical protein MTO98_04130 [Mucilaginibacter sp. SMC90]
MEKSQACTLAAGPANNKIPGFQNAVTISTLLSCHFIYKTKNWPLLFCI